MGTKASLHRGRPPGAGSGKVVANRRAQPFACVLGGQNVLAGGREAQLRDGLLDFGDLIVGDEEKSALWGNVSWISALLPR